MVIDMKKIRTAVVGLGFIGISHVKGHKDSPNIELVAFVDMNQDIGEKLSAEYGVKYYRTLEELLNSEEVDMVDICVPTWLHEECIVTAAKYGKHVMCEKPITFTLESFDRITKAVTDMNVKFMVAQVIRFWPEYVRIKELYEKGKFGSIQYASARRLAETPNWSEWYKDPAKSGGALYDLMLHDVDFLNYLFGEAESVYATGKQSETGCWNYVQADILFKSGVGATVESTNAAFGNYPFTMGFRMFGSDMIANYELIAGHNIDSIGKRELYTYSKVEGAVKQSVDEFDPYSVEIDYFADCIINNRTCDVVSIESSRRTLQLILAIKKSLETNELVKL